MMKFALLLSCIVALAAAGTEPDKDLRRASNSQVGRGGYEDNSWLTTIIVIAIPLILIPYILFLFTSVPYGGGYGHGHHGGHGGGYGWGHGRSSKGPDEQLTKRVLSAI